MKTAMQELIEDIDIEKKLGYITENAANRILDYINNLYLKEEKEQILQAYIIAGINNIDKKKLPNLDLDYFKICANEYFLRNYNQNK